MSKEEKIRKLSHCYLSSTMCRAAMPNNRPKSPAPLVTKCVFEEHLPQ